MQEAKTAEMQKKRKEKQEAERLEKERLLKDEEDATLKLMAEAEANLAAAQMDAFEDMSDEEPG